MGQPETGKNGVEYVTGKQPLNGGTVATRRALRLPVDNQRAEFLRSCRARVKPADLGLPPAQRKRTDGLRREDVAALSGVSASWYTWLEQGRDMRVSDKVLERLCRTFRMSEDERVYLFTLVQHRPPPASGQGQTDVPPDVVRMIEALSVPAIVRNLRWDVLAWNRMNSVFYRDYAAIPATERNLLEILLTRPVSHLSPTQFEDMARRLIARLRFDYSRYAGDPRFEVLVRRLERLSPVFKRIWRNSEFSLRAYGIHRFTHSHFGELVFEHSSSAPDGNSEIRVLICTPHDEATWRAVAQAKAQLSGTESRSARVASGSLG